VEKLAIGIVDRKVELLVAAAGDADLEEWAVRRKQSLFEEVFDVELSTFVESRGRTFWEPDGAHAGLG
jgi:hypothetical protein